MNNNANYVPDPLDTYSQYARFYHLDIAVSADSDLIEEVWAIRSLLWGLPADDWLRERHQKLEAELRKRHWRETEYSARKIPTKAEGVQL